MLEKHTSIILSWLQVLQPLADTHNLGKLQNNNSETLDGVSPSQDTHSLKLTKTYMFVACEHWKHIETELKCHYLDE